MIKRAQGEPGARCTPGLVCRNAQKAHTSIQVQRRQSGFPCAVVYGLFRALPGEPSSFATVTSRLISTKLSASVGRQDHTTSPSARVTLVSRNFRVHRIPPHVRDDREPPLSSGETGEVKSVICPTAKAKYFCAEGWTGSR